MLSRVPTRCSGIFSSASMRTPSDARSVRAVLRTESGSDMSCRHSKIDTYRNSGNRKHLEGTLGVNVTNCRENSPFGTRRRAACQNPRRRNSASVSFRRGRVQRRVCRRVRSTLRTFLRCDTHHRNTRSTLRFTFVHVDGIDLKRRNASSERYCRPSAAAAATQRHEYPYSEPADPDGSRTNLQFARFRSRSLQHRYDVFAHRSHTDAQIRNR